MQRSEVATTAVASPGGVWSQAVVVQDASRMLFVSGLTSREPDGAVFGEDDIEAQTERVLESLSAILGAAGGGLADVVKVTVFVRNIEDFPTIHAVRRRFFSPPYPASSMVEVSRLVDKRSLIEIEAIAVLS